MFYLLFNFDLIQAPEVLRKEAYRFAVDLWSFGVIMIKLIQKTYPFKNADDTEEYKKQVINYAPILSHKVNINYSLIIVISWFNLGYTFHYYLIITKLLPNYYLNICNLPVTHT